MSKKEKALITVIVPIYNIEEYIAPCVKTIINQSYKNLEILLVDDGSTDNSPKICDKYKESDKRINVIHKKNGGLSDARNVAIEKAKGDFIFLLDGDDTIHERIIEVLHQNIKKYKADIATSSFLQFEDGTKPRAINLSKSCVKCLDTEGALENMLYQKGCTNTAWGKLYKKELFDNIRYPKGELYEDLATTYKLFSKAKRIVVDDRKMYNYRQRYGSIVNNSFSLKHLRSLDFVKEQTAFIEKNEMPKGKFRDEYRELVKGIKKYRRIVVKDRKSLFKPRLIAGLSYIGFWTLRPTMKLLRSARIALGK